MKSTRVLHTWAILLACLVALVTAACGSIEPSPTSPSPTPAPSPAPGSVGGRLAVTVAPNPVPWSGQAIADAAGCTNVPNTWFYTQVLTNSGTNAITVNDRVDLFNGAQVSTRGSLGIALAAGATTSITTRWCSVASGAQTAQTNWSGVDTTTGAALAVTGPMVTLQAR